jgi:molecular chaperone GrpE
VSKEKKNANTIENLEAASAETSSAGPEESNQVTELQQALAAKTEEWQALNDRYLRLAAEFENYKRLAQRDQRDHIRYGNEQILKELLPVVDNLERAVKAAKDNGNSESLVQGVDLTLKQLMGVLTKFGVQPVATVAQPFDPTAHHAVASVVSPQVAENHVVEEFQRGYRLHDRILRAAMVSVSTGPTQNSANDTDKTSDTQDHSSSD